LIFIQCHEVFREGAKNGVSSRAALPFGSRRVRTAYVKEPVVAGGFDGQAGHGNLMKLYHQIMICHIPRECDFLSESHQSA
jgi:hypothetical protein